MTRFCKIQLLALILVLHARAHGQCTLSFTTTNISVNWIPTFTYISVPITVTRGGPDTCDFGIGFTKGGGTSYATRRASDGGGNYVDYQLYKESGFANILKEIPDATTGNDLVTGGFSGGGTTQPVDFFFRIPYNLDVAPALLSAGTFTDSFTVNLYEGNDPLTFGTPADTETISVTVTVPKMIAISIVNTGSTFIDGETTKNLNFGPMYEGQSLGVDLRVRSNAGFDVTFSSLNNGNMKHVSSTSLVPYKFYVNGALLDMSSSLGTPVLGLSRPGQTAWGGLAYPLRVVVGNVAAGTVKLSGTHTDSITITATTTE